MKDEKAWRQSAEGDALYRRVRAEAQALSNRDGFDRGVEFNDLFHTCRHFLLPQKRHRSGHEVAERLRDENRWWRDNRTPDSDDLDVRLQCYPDGTWALRTGDSQYDQDHRGYWGCGTLDGEPFDARDMAREIIEQCKEQAAMNGEETEPGDSFESDDLVVQPEEWTRALNSGFDREDPEE